MLAALTAGALSSSRGGQVTVMVFTAIGMCMTWPALAALVCEGESPANLQHMVGLYNVIWAGTGALADFTGGAMLDKLGIKSLFYVPGALVAGQLVLTLWLEKQARNYSESVPQVDEKATSALATAQTDFNASFRSVNGGLNPRPIAKVKAFRSMAWLANPFAYVALNTLIAVIPGIAKRMELSTTLAGFCCSVWYFARLGSFFAFWLWNGWHYRFRYLLTAYAALVGSFALIVLTPNLSVLVLAQIIFGFALGLIYCSSLFYSMDLSETKGAHGGVHEAAIGLGNFAGPAVGAASLHFLPHLPSSGVFAVSLLLVGGLVGLLALWKRGKQGYV